MNSTKLLCTLSGDDYSIIQSSGANIKNRFMAIGGFVLVMFILCFFSSYFTFSKLFQNYFISIPVALFFAWMITNIYLLILYTLSKNSFPCVSNGAARAFSITIRVIFICFIAVVVSKPIETIIYHSLLEAEIQQYKKEQIAKYSASTSAYFDAETKNIKLIIEKQKNLYPNIETGQIQKYSELLAKRETQKLKLIRSMNVLVNKSKYYIQSIIILNSKYKSCWLITFLSILIFLFPAYLKNFLGENSMYYEQKRKIENRIVIEEYGNFKIKYAEIFKERHHDNKMFSESFIDPPFNTIRKKDNREFKKESDLLTDLYNA